MTVWSSSTKSITSLAATTSSIITLTRCSNSPRNIAPARSPPISRLRIRLLANQVGTSPSLIRLASPSIKAVLPTPGSPKTIGLFLVLRLRISIRRLISPSRSTIAKSSSRAILSLRLIVKYESADWILPPRLVFGGILAPLGSTGCGLLWLWKISLRIVLSLSDAPPVRPMTFWPWESGVSRIPKNKCSKPI